MVAMSACTLRGWLSFLEYNFYVDGISFCFFFLFVLFIFIYFFFFFQAEDGIRDIGVTGVQTCALPIWARGVRVDGLHLDRVRHVADRRVDADAPRPQRVDGGREPLVTACAEHERRARFSEAFRHFEQIGRASCRERVEMAVHCAA